MQWVLVSLVKIFVAVLEAAIGGHPTASNNEDCNFYANDHKNKDDGVIDAAYKFFELEQPVTMEEVKKKYKKLSLRYHPDRNGGSNESQEMMQKLNACLQIIEKDMAEGQDNDDDDEDREEDHQKTAQERWKEQEAMRRKMQEEMQEEMKRHEERKKEFHQKKQSEKNAFQRKAKELNLNSQEGRQVAHEKFQAQRKDAGMDTAKSTTKTSEQPDTSMDDIDDRNEDAPADTLPTQTTVSKPKNSVMDYNTEEIIVALRMGLPDVALELWSASFETHKNDTGKNAYFTGEKITSQDMIRTFLEKPIDDDGNTLLNYANYYECYQVCQLIYQNSQKAQWLEQILNHTNVHGDTVLVFAQISQDQSILALYQSQVELVEVIKTQSQFLPAVKAAGIRVFQIVWHVDIAATSSTLLSFYIGHCVAGLHSFPTLMGMGMMKFFVEDEVQRNKRIVAQVTVLVGFYGTWIAIWTIVNWVLQVVMWELVLILAPFAMAGYVSKQQRKRVGAIGMILAPIGFLAMACRYAEPVYGVVNRRLTPKFILQGGYLMPYLLLVTILASVGLSELYQIVL